jgi:pantoate--beta-alanine ligase
VLVASVFVNPAQFADGADLASYPRDEKGDFALAEAEGVDVLFAPSADELYPPGFATWVEPAGAADGLESEHRPHHFRGVATVCLKLLNIVRPQIAWFGRKDAQQVAVVKQLVRDLNLPVEIRVVETVRDSDGLALSSRNRLLSPAERAQALAIPRALATRDPADARRILGEAGLQPDYVEVADLDGPTLAIAARVGPVRLIDNIPLPKGDDS